MLPAHEFKTIIDIAIRFPTEKSCHQYLASRRWNGYMECPYDDCDNDTAFVFKDGIRYKCKCCKRIYTAKTNTIFESSKLPLLKWFFAMFLAMHKKGISSIQLAKDIGVTQKTAWFVLQRIRKALGNEESEEQLDGVVEVDEAFIGGAAKWKHKNKRPKYNPGRSWKDKQPVIGMLQRNGKVRAFKIEDVTMLTLRKAVMEHIKKGSCIMGDGYQGYKGFLNHYDVKMVDHSIGNYVNGESHTNGIENYWSHLKRGLRGTYIKVSRKHLNAYIDETSFRYNYRNLTMHQQMETIISKINCRLKYKDLTAA